jgi:hypothetical protein
MSHLDIDVLEALAAGVSRPDAEGHLERCAECRRERDWLVAERALVGAHRAADAVDKAALDGLWQGIASQVAPASAGPARRGRWLAAASVAVLAAAAALLLLGRRGAMLAPGPRPSPALASAGADAGAAPVPDDHSPAAGNAAARAVADAEAAYERALDAVEADYQRHRPGLSPATTAALDQGFAQSRSELGEARRAAGDDLDARVLVLDLYATQVRTLGGAVRRLDRDAPLPTP